MYGIFTCIWLIFHGFHVGKYTSPMDGMGTVISEGCPSQIDLGSRFEFCPLGRRILSPLLGVELCFGTSPGGSMAKQTRKWLHFQSQGSPLQTGSSWWSLMFLSSIWLKNFRTVSFTSSFWGFFMLPSLWNWSCQAAKWFVMCPGPLRTFRRWQCWQRRHHTNPNRFN